MVTVRFQQSGGSGSSGREHQVPRGTTLLDAVRGAGLPIASACGAEHLCGRCALEILESGTPLAPETAAERRVKLRNRVDPAARLACCVRLEADTVVRAPYW